MFGTFHGMKKILVMTGEQYCNHRWMASRVDTVNETVPVQHMCKLDKDHYKMVHECACGAILQEDNSER